ncbi:MAG TPA: carboxylesterase family protein, partial [Edaphobacter sp.]
MIFRKSFGCLLVSLTIASNISSAATAKSSDPVKTESGDVQGIIQDGVISFKGIPFAAPPVGELRWKAPQP